MPKKTKEKTGTTKPCSCSSHSQSESDCSCNKSKSTESRKETAFVLGSLGYDLGGFARSNSLDSQMKGNPNNPEDLVEYLKENPWEASSVAWTLTLNNDSSPTYAIQPKGSFSTEFYGLLVRAYEEQLKGKIDQVALGGDICGIVNLTSKDVSVICPNRRCFYSWNVDSLINHFLGKGKRETKLVKEEYVDTLMNFLNLIYYKYRNLGLSPTDRALNFAATNLILSREALIMAVEKDYQLESISVNPTPTNQEELWDVTFRFFNPSNTKKARLESLYTVDLHFECPSIVGSVKSWYIS